MSQAPRSDVCCRECRLSCGCSSGRNSPLGKFTSASVCRLPLRVLRSATQALRFPDAPSGPSRARLRSLPARRHSCRAGTSRSGAKKASVSLFTPSAAPAASVISLAKSSKNLFVVWVIIGSRIEGWSRLWRSGFQACKVASSRSHQVGRPRRLTLRRGFPNNPPQVGLS